MIPRIVWTVFFLDDLYPLLIKDFLGWDTCGITYLQMSVATDCFHRDFVIQWGRLTRSIKTCYRDVHMTYVSWTGRIPSDPTRPKEKGNQI